MFTLLKAYVSQLYTREPPMMARIVQHSMIIIFFYTGVRGWTGEYDKYIGTAEMSES